MTKSPESRIIVAIQVCIAMILVAFVANTIISTMQRRADVAKLEQRFDAARTRLLDFQKQVEASQKEHTELLRKLGEARK